MEKNWKVGDRVRWVSNDEEYGRVIEIGYAGVKVRWDDDVVAMYLYREPENFNIVKLK